MWHSRIVPILLFINFVWVLVWHPYRCIDTDMTWKMSCFSSEIRYPYDRQPLNSSRHFPYMLLTYLSVDEILQPNYVKCSINFRELILYVEMSPSGLKYRNSVLFAFRWKPIPLPVFSNQCNRYSACVWVFERSATV